MKKKELIVLVATATIGVSCRLSETPTPASIEVDKGRAAAITEMPVPAPTAVPPIAPLFEDDFENGEGEWFVEELPEHSIYISQGQFIIEVQESQWNAYAGHSDLLLLDTYALEVDISYVSGPTDSEAGLAFRCDADDEAWLELSFNADGLFTVSSVTSGEEQLDFVDVIPYALVPALRHGQSTNHIRLVDDDKLVTVSINDELIATFPYEDLPPGCPFFFAGTYEEGGAKWAFDNVFIWEIERSGDTAVPAPVTILASQVSSLTMQALRKAVGAPPLTQASTTALVSFRPPAEQGTYRVDCPASGYMEMTELPDDLPLIGEFSFENAIQIYKDCTYFDGDLQYTTNGTLTVGGSYHVDEALPQNIQVAGRLATSPGEDCPVDGRVSADGAFAGTICAWPITIDPLPPPPPALEPAELLAGQWSGRASFRDSSFGCTGPANFTFVIQGSGEIINGTYTYTIGNSIGPDPICSRACSNGGVVGCSVSGTLSGSARNGTINFTAGGLTVEGTYRQDGQWMVGHYQGTALGGFYVSGDWQTILK